MKKTVFILIVTFVLVLGLESCMSEGQKAAKPVIYFYPEVETEVMAELDYNGELTCTYPEYKDGWKVTAYPDGTLINHADGKEYTTLFWEGTDKIRYDMSKGFVVKGEDTAAFLEEKLAYLGLNTKERNEFIMCWLPKMQDSPYNLITFQDEVYEENAKLIVTPEPDSMIRVFMVYQTLNQPVETEEQELTKGVREGFTVVEWGGCELR